jgi:ParB/RepB/Spo0J family partition protein
MSKDNYKIVKVEEIAFPSFMPKSETSITDLQASINSYGFLQPIGICKNDDKELEEYKYLVIWGRKRLLAAHNLDIKKIPAVIIDIKPSREEFLKYSLMESQTSVPMNLVDVWNAIRELYFIHGEDEKIISKMTGIPLPVVKDAVFENRVRNISGGPELIDYCRNECNLTNRVSKDIFYLLIDNENYSVDKKKGKKLADVLAVLDFQMRNKVLRAAEANPKGDVDGWVADAKKIKSYKKLEGTIDIQLIEEEDYGLLKMAEANGLTANEMIRKILKEKLVKEGLLEEE